MTTHDYAQAIREVALESGKRAASLADAHDLAKMFGDNDTANKYHGEMLGILYVLELIDKKLDEHSD